MAEFKANIIQESNTIPYKGQSINFAKNSLQGRLVQIGSAVVLNEVGTSFLNMVNSLESDRGVVLIMEQGYLSEYEVVDELRKLVKFKTKSLKPEMLALLDPKKPMSEIIKDADQYQKLKTYVDSLDATEFEPPLKPDFMSAGGINTVCFPNKTSQDPRRSGKLIKIGPSNLVKSPEIFKWLLNNSFLFGFVLYEENALYYLGADAINQKVQQAAYPRQELRKIVGSFIQSSDALSLFTRRI